MAKKSPNKRTSGCALSYKGSITAEASVIISFFFLAMICLTYLFEILSLQVTIRNSMHAVGRELAVNLYQNPLVLAERIEKDMVEHIGKERLDHSLVVRGSEGIDCGETKKRWNSSIVDLSAVYEIEIPILLFRIPIIKKEEILRIKGWTGYETVLDLGDGEELVYVTEYGLVYHKERECTYLDLSIRTVQQDTVDELRNLNGGKYHPCTSCGGKTVREWVYITDYGDRYHRSLECRKLKRNVYTIPIREVYGLGGCSKCVK